MAGSAKLTLNLGIRYDVDTPRTERRDRMNYFDPLALSPLAKQQSQFPDLRLDGITPYNLLPNPYPDAFQPPPGSSAGLLTQAGSNIDAMLRDTVTPWSSSSSFR